MKDSIIIRLQKRKESNMEENNNNQENNKYSVHECHCWKKSLVIALGAFLGSFLAFYFIADQMAERTLIHNFNPYKYEKRMIKDIERMYKQDMKAFDDSFNFDKKFINKHQNFITPVFMPDTVKIQTEYDDNKFNVIVGLKEFQNDENKIKYTVKGRKLTVFGNNEVKDKDFEHDISFSQDFVLPENADTTNISKIKDGNKVIISVPVKEQI